MYFNVIRLWESIYIYDVFILLCNTGFTNDYYNIFSQDDASSFAANS